MFSHINGSGVTMKKHWVMAALCTAMMFAIANGKVRDKRHGISEPASEHYVFEPVLTHCPTCIHKDNIYSTKKQGGGHAQELEFSFTANGTRYDIALELNERLLSSGFSVSYLGYEGEAPEIYKEESVEELNNCYYHGHVIGVENSRVVASTCHGLKGTIYLHNDTIHFAPLEPKTRKHALYREVTGDDHSCGTSNDEMLMRQSLTASATKSSPIRVKRQEEEQKFVELLLVVDKEMYDKFDDMDGLHEHIKELVNYVDVMYKLLELRIVLMHLEVWTTQDKIVISDNAETTLHAFVAHRQQKLASEPPTSPWRYTDNAHLIVGRVFDDNILGMAPISAMCADASAGVSRDRIAPRDTAATVTHEMGHNFGMYHDTETCNCTSGSCFMSTLASNAPPNDWSSCSRQYLESGYRNGLDVCLKDTPDSDKIFGGPTCGNGIVEVNEECDCGGSDYCKSSCCNATTCKLLDGAQCDTGACCSDDCQYKEACHVCRTAVGDCDITEYCSGEAAHCPDDSYKFNGYLCDSDEGLCYSGVCKTRGLQCREMFGAGAIEGTPLCYSTFNKKGLWYGHCGANADGTFNACPDEDILCGKLLCIGGADKPIISTGGQAAIATIGGQKCKSIQSPSDTSEALSDPTMVSDGLKCDDGKVCHDGACSDSSVYVKPCNRTCNGHGICNNRGNCHCDAGYAPPDCKEPGNGGSVDSGPICGYGDNSTADDTTSATSTSTASTTTTSTTASTPTSTKSTTPTTTTTSTTATSTTSPTSTSTAPTTSTTSSTSISTAPTTTTSTTTSTTSTSTASTSTTISTTSTTSTSTASTTSTSTVSSSRTEPHEIDDDAGPSTAGIGTDNASIDGGSVVLLSFSLLTVSAIFMSALFE